MLPAMVFAMRMPVSQRRSAGQGSRALAVDPQHGASRPSAGAAGARSPLGPQCGPGATSRFVSGFVPGRDNPCRRISVYPAWRQAFVCPQLLRKGFIPHQENKGEGWARYCQLTVRLGPETSASVSVFGQMAVRYCAADTTECVRIVASETSRPTQLMETKPWLPMSLPGPCRRKKRR